MHEVHRNIVGPKGTKVELGFSRAEKGGKSTLFSVPLERMSPTAGLIYRSIQSPTLLRDAVT